MAAKDVIGVISERTGPRATKGYAEALFAVEKGLQVHAVDRDLWTEYEAVSRRLQQLKGELYASPLYRVEKVLIAGDTPAEKPDNPEKPTDEVEPGRVASPNPSR